uniref:PROP1-like PPR domain-containing protein n=2 Tax=Quercus lobata TaxID=97700 RepID=A0A7N2LQL0_QUELO
MANLILPFLARRLQRTPAHLLLLSHIIPSLSSSPSPSSKLPFHFLFHALHQTSLIPTLQTHHFSTFQPFSAHNLDDPFDFNHPRFRTYDPHDRFLLRFLELLREFPHYPSEAEAMTSLDDSGIEVNSEMIYSAVWELREEWRLALLAFRWSEKWGCADEKSSNLMIWVLGNHRKFNTAWCLIRDMHQSKVDTRRAMLIMIDRYASANDPCKAIGTFHIMEKFRLSPDQQAFHTVLNALCKYGNVEEAEEFMFVNKKLFPLETEGFNIILNGWCNISLDIFEAKRVWREMSKCCITPDATSYTNMISCFAKVGNLFDSLRLYEEMKKRSWVPGLKVYNSLIYVLTCQNCLEQALKILAKMKGSGLQPDSATYNSMIHPLCEAKMFEEARNILTVMMEENLGPTMETYHSFLEGAGFEGTLEILNQMRKAGLGPTGDSFLIILSRFFKLGQPENALKIWVEMKQYEVEPSHTHQSVLVQGLATCGWLTKAREFYADMRSKGFAEDPKLKKLLKEPARDSMHKGKRRVQQLNREGWVNHGKGSRVRWKIHRNKSRRKKKEIKKSNLEL